jgi:hypothetical protein
MLWRVRHRRPALPGPRQWSLRDLFTLTFFVALCCGCGKLSSALGLGAMGLTAVWLLIHRRTR